MKKFLLGTFMASAMLSTNVFANDYVEIMPISAPISVQPISAVNTGTVFTTNERSTIKVSPDMATVNVNVTNSATTSADAKALNDAAVLEVTNNLVSSGLLAEDAISTANFYIYPIYNYDYTTDTSKEEGYRADTTLKIVVSDLDDLNEVFDSVLETSSTSISYTTFETSKYEEYYNMALVQSITKAQERVSFIADQVFAGSTASITNISSYGSSNTYYYEEMALGVSNMKTADTVDYVPNSIDVSAQAEVTFSIR